MTTDAGEPLRVLFVKERMGWPRSSGHDVHTFFLMQALARQGHAVAFAAMAAIPPEATADGGLAAEYCFVEHQLPTADFPLRLSPRQEKFRNYWGIDAEKVQWVGAAAADFRADAVVVSGLNVLPYLGALPDHTVKAWYAADEWVWHHWSQVRPFRRATWADAKLGLVKGLYERAYRSLLDRVWVVSPADAAAFRWFAGIRQTDVLPNGVDADHYRPGDEDQHPDSCVFWGRLDFGPNVQALEWFCGKVWPLVRERVPHARFRVFGFQPTPAVQTLVGRDGIELTPDLPDLRAAVRSHQVAVMPFVSGGGIKNKLLEAAAMGLPTLCSKRAFTGLIGNPPQPTAGSPRDWAEQLIHLWKTAAARQVAGRAAREWVTRHHTWDAAAATAAAGLRAVRRPTPAPVL